MANRTENMERGRGKHDKSPALRILGTIGLICLVTCAMLACMAALYIKLVIIPDSQLKLADFKPTLNLTTTVYYNDPESGQPVEMNPKLHGTENRIWVPYNEIPQDLVDAAVAIEDKRFYKHHGVDWIRTSKGIISMFTGQDIQGGSTITQQLIKNLTTENQVTVKRKVKEIFRALGFEKDSSKEEILEWYLNCIFLGEGCNGVYTASYAYFGKKVSELSLAECASLIGITNNPSLYNPYRNEEANKKRQENILWAMYDQKKISKEEYDSAIAEKLQFVRGKDEVREQVVYNWYVDTVIDEVIQDLKNTYHYSEQAAAAMVYSGGLQIYTNMNPQVQTAVEEVYYDRQNLNFTSSTGQPMQSAITVVDNESGNVIAIAGAMGEKKGSRILNRANGSKRPPGSAIKPLGVYAPALELGLISPLNVEQDSPYENSWPVNSYGSYRGNMTMMEALRVSCNTIAVKVLAKHVTPEASFEFMRDRFHIELVESRTVGDKVFSDVDLAPLALGGLTDGITTWDMAAAYSVFPREGIYYEPSTYSKVLDKEGNVLLERNASGQVALKPKTAYYINEMLQPVVQSGTGTAANFKGMDIAGKTGTTTSKKDLWFVGYTPYYTAAVWTGYDQQEAVRNVGANPSAVLWRKVMQKAHNGLAYEKFAAPPNSDLVSVPYCKSSGKLATSNCPSTGVISLYKEDVPKGTCSVHQRSSSRPSFDINNPDTWPKNDTNFKPEDSSTWPGASGGSTGETTGGTPGGTPGGTTGGTTGGDTSGQTPTETTKPPPAEEG